MSTWVSGIILVGVTMTRPREIDWLYRGLHLLLPTEWERFRACAPAQERDGNLVEAYRRLMEHPVLAVRERAARDWCAWEDAVIAHEALGNPGQYSAKPDKAKLAFVRICTHRPQCVVRRRANTAECPEAQRDSGCPHPRAPRFVRTAVDRLGTRTSLARRPVEGHRGLRSHRQPGNGHRHPGRHRSVRQ